MPIKVPLLEDPPIPANSIQEHLNSLVVYDADDGKQIDPSGTLKTLHERFDL